MSPAVGRASSRGDTLRFLLCLALSGVALVLPAAWVYPLTTAIRETALLPVVWVQQRAEEDRGSRARLKAVTAERDAAALKAQSLTGILTENERLRALLSLRQKITFPTVAAEVLHQVSATDGRTLLLSAGRRAGILPGDAVVSAEGLVGLVVSAGPASSIAMTWAHPDFRVSGVTEDGSVLGIVGPASTPNASEAFLEYRGVPYRDTVPAGTLVLSSGISGQYPKGVPIGRIAGIRREELGWERIYRITPLANPGQISHVLVYVIRAARRPDPPATDSIP
ncbi:MAG: rod shape-determining protein MreC [Gemmatimonadota bacterium]